jgi:hypothetical protein
MRYGCSRPDIYTVLRCALLQWREYEIIIITCLYFCLGEVEYHHNLYLTDFLVRFFWIIGISQGKKSSFLSIQQHVVFVNRVKDFALVIGLQIISLKWFRNLLKSAAAVTKINRDVHYWKTPNFAQSIQFVLRESHKFNEIFYFQSCPSLGSYIRGFSSSDGTRLTHRLQFFWNFLCY